MTMLYRLFLYDHWANREVVKRLREIETPQPAALRILAHIVGSEWLWHARLTAGEPKMAVWPELTLDECDREVEMLRGLWGEYVTSADLASSIEYRNTKGEKWTSRVEDVLTHLVIHGGYHRGQIATAIRATDEVPPYTDFIQCTRTGAI
jgi:uncharacterized damage-inducible protein DinB